MGDAIFAKKQDCAFGGNEATLVGAEELERKKGFLIEGAAPLERLGGGFQIEVFECEPGHGEFVEGESLSCALKFGNEFAVGLAIAGSETNEDAIFGSICTKKMGTGIAEKGLDDEECLAFAGDHLNIRHKAWGDGIRNETAKALFFRQGIFNTNDLPIVSDADHDPTAGRIGKRDQRLQEWLR